jgi:hypothetical protein
MNESAAQKEVPATAGNGVGERAVNSGGASGSGIPAEELARLRAFNDSLSRFEYSLEAFVAAAPALDTEKVFSTA